MARRLPSEGVVTTVAFRGAKATVYYLHNGKPTQLVTTRANGKLVLKSRNIITIQDD